MGEKVTINNRQAGRQINAYCSVLCQVPCTCRSMPHRQVHRLIRCTCPHCDLLPKRNALHANGEYIQRTYGKGRHLYNASIRNLERLLRICYPSKYPQWSPQGNSRLHLLLQAFPFGCLSCLQCYNWQCVSHPHLLSLCKQNHRHAVSTSYHNCHQCNKHSVCQCYTNLNLLFVYELHRKQICNYPSPPFAPNLLSKYESSNLCKHHTFRLRILSSSLLEKVHYILSKPTCRLYNTPKPYSRLLGKGEKYPQFLKGNTFHNLALSEHRTTIPRAFRHKYVQVTSRLIFATTLQLRRQSFSNHCHLGLYKSVQPRLLLGKSNNSFLDNNSKIHQRLVFQSFRNSFLFVIFSFSYNPCIILIINRVENKLTYGFEASDFAEVPLTQNRQNLLREEWNSATVNPLGISPVNRTLSNILELGCVGLSWNITLSTAPTKFRSLHLASPMLRQEADGGIGLLFLLNVRQNKNAPAIRTGMGLQGHIYVVPKPSYLFNAIASLTLNQKALQIYNEKLNGARSVKIVLTFNSLLNMPYCGNIAKIHKRLVYNYLCINFLHVLGCLFPVLKVMGLNPIGVTSGKLVDNQYFTTFLFFIIEYIPP